MTKQKTVQVQLGDFANKCYITIFTCPQKECGKKWMDRENVKSYWDKKKENSSVIPVYLDQFCLCRDCQRLSQKTLEFESQQSLLLEDATKYAPEVNV